MKGVSHVAIALASASCFPGAVEAGAQGNPLYFILAAAFGLLPDTLDFKLTRFFYKTDITVTPDPNAPDAQMIADAVAYAVNRAGASGEPVSIKLNTIQMGVDQWQRYTVKFDVPARRVIVRLGPLVDTGQTPIGPVPPGREGVAPLHAHIALDYLAATDIDIFDGPVYRMEPTDGNRVRPIFIPWHRTWSHSFVVAMLLALWSTVLWDGLAGWVVFAAMSTHIIADQAGYMGSNLFYPFTRHRTTGLRLMHAVWPLPNFVAVWISGVVIVWNLYHGHVEPLAPLNPLRVFLLWIMVPAGLFYAAHKRVQGGTDPVSEPS